MTQITLDETTLTLKGRGVYTIGMQVMKIWKQSKKLASGSWYDPQLKLISTRSSTALVIIKYQIKNENLLYPGEGG